MFDKEKLCKKIMEVYPDIGQCGIDLNVEYDENEKAWVVDLQHGKKTLKHFLEDKDAELCMDGKQCVSLGLEIIQMKQHIEAHA